MSFDDQLSIGVLVGPYLYEWQVDALERLRIENGVTIPLVVGETGTKGENDAESWNEKNRLRVGDLRQFLEVLKTEKAWSLVLAERNVAKIIGTEKPTFRRHTVEGLECFDDAEFVQCSPETNDGWAEFPEDVVARIRDCCDVVVRFGFGLVRGSILTAPRYGVLSFHPADIRRFRGMGPPAVFHDGRTVTGSTLQRLDDSIDGGEIVAYADIDIADCDTLWDVFDRVLSRQRGLLIEGITNVRDPDFEPTRLTDDELGEFYYRKQRHGLAFSGRVLLKNVVGRIRRRFGTKSPSETTIEQPSGSSE
ncbi:formyltransferase family protein [Halostagnicola bangensis]